VTAREYPFAVSAPPVLLVHGFASSFERNWREPGWVDLLADLGREVIPLDLPGHGSAAKPHEPDAYADLASAVTAALPAEPVDVIAFSLGASLVLTAACRQPDRFGRIVVAGVGASLFRSGKTDAAAMARAVETGAAADGDPAAAGAFARFGQGSGNDPIALAACLRRPDQPLRPGDLASLDRPVLVVLGDHDFAGPAEPLLEALPDARLVLLRGLDHFGTPKDFRFVDAALDFLGASS
jgi:pimeloyl-ACP methyl ester carboxylesterase